MCIYMYTCVCIYIYICAGALCKKVYLNRCAIDVERERERERERLDQLRMLLLIGRVPYRVETRQQVRSRGHSTLLD